MQVFVKCLVILYLLGANVCFSQNKLVRIEVGYHELYCGGARPSEEMIAEAQKTKPYANHTLVLINAKNKACKVKTDKDGVLQIKLKDGKYKIKEVWRHQKSTPSGAPLAHFDKECLKPEWEMVALEITVLNGKPSVLVINDIVVPCAWAYPCLLEAHRPPVAE